MLDWMRSGNDDAKIASVMVSGIDKYRLAARAVFSGDVVPYSGIVQTADGSYEGEVIEKTCYQRGGLIFLYKSYAPPDVTEDYFPTSQFMKLIGNLFRQYLIEIGRDASSRFWMDACWAVCQRSGDYGTLHNHLPLDYDGHDRFSGIMYLSMPPSINPSTFPNGCLHIVVEEAVHYFPPVPGTVLFWPSNLLHGIHPFRGRGDRLAIAFDMAVA